jgi:hypothetical protein
VVEGWVDKYNSANAGLGIIIALVIAGFVALAILYAITFKRLKKQKERKISF